MQTTIARLGRAAVALTRLEPLCSEAPSATQKKASPTAQLEKTAF